MNFGNEERNFGLDTKAQKQIDSFIAQQPAVNKPKIRAFNPNFISDFKGYLLGMNPDEIDRLHTYRESGLFVNSAREFQQVTKISDSLLNILTPLFEFPEWSVNSTPDLSRSKDQINRAPINIDPIKGDLNKVDAADLMDIYGIGPVLSQRILKFRKALGGYLIDDQLYDVYGLDAKVADRILEQYTVLNQPEVAVVNINMATSEELANSVYISNLLARRIIQLRDSLGTINSYDELTKIQDFPTDKINRIKLYLTL